MRAWIPAPLPRDGHSLSWASPAIPFIALSPPFSVFFRPLSARVPTEGLPEKPAPLCHTAAPYWLIQKKTRPRCPCWCIRANGWIGGGIPRHRPGPLAFATAGLARRQHPRAPVSGPSSNSQHHQPAGSWSWKLRHPAHRHTAGRSIWTEEIRRGGRGRSDGGARASRCCHSTRS